MATPTAEDRKIGDKLRLLQNAINNAYKIYSGIDPLSKEFRNSKYASFQKTCLEIGDAIVGAKMDIEKMPK